MHRHFQLGACAYFARYFPFQVVRLRLPVQGWCKTSLTRLLGRRLFQVATRPPGARKPYQTAQCPRLSSVRSSLYMNTGFIDENHILENMYLTCNIPGRIVHRRYDMVCTLEKELELLKHCSAAELHIARELGYSASELGTVDALMRATKDIAKELKTSG